MFGGNRSFVVPLLSASSSEEAFLLAASQAFQ
jgi:hypothetical protein